MTMKIAKLKNLLTSVFARNLIIINIALLFCLGLSAVPGIAQTLRAPVAYFAATPSNGPAPLSVQFTDRSRGTVSSWTWEFGDGATSTAKNPSHSYTTAGIYTAKLTVKNSSGSSYQTTSISATGSQPPPVSAPAANFSLAPGGGQAPLAVQFTNSSTGTVSSWAWDFGDSATRSNPSPSHTYTSPGSYTARLTVSNASGSSSKTASVTATSSALPTANFSASPGSGQAPLNGPVYQYLCRDRQLVGPGTLATGLPVRLRVQAILSTIQAATPVKLTVANATGPAYKIASISALDAPPPQPTGAGLLFGCRRRQ